MKTLIAYVGLMMTLLLAASCEKQNNTSEEVKVQSTSESRSAPTLKPTTQPNSAPMPAPSPESR